MLNLQHMCLNVEKTVKNAKRYTIISHQHHTGFNFDIQKSNIVIWEIKRRLNTDIIALDTGNLDHTMLVVAGWNTTAENNPISSKLLDVHLSPYNNQHSFNDNKTHGKEVFPMYQICTGFPRGGKNVCQVGLKKNWVMSGISSRQVSSLPHKNKEDPNFSWAQPINWQ